MPGFYGLKTVLATRRKHMRTGKVVSGTLKVRIAGGQDTFTSVAWGNLYIHPQTEVSGFDHMGFADIDGVITMYRLGEASAPRVDDQIVVGTTVYLIKHVTPRLNADEASNMAVYDVLVTS